MSTIKDEVSHDERKGVYEIGYFLVSSIPEEKVADIAGSLKDIILKKKGEMIGEEAPEKRPLAYSMTKKIGAKNHKFTEGYFGWLKFALEPDAIKAIHDELERDETIIRFMIIKTVRENTISSKKSFGYRPRRDDSSTDEKIDNTEENKEAEQIVEADVDRAVDALVTEA